MKNSPEFMIIGSKGQLGFEFCKLLESKGLSYSSFDIDSIDIADIAALKAFFNANKPRTVINCSAYNQVDLAENDPTLAFRVNHEGVKNIAALCYDYKAFLVHFSSDYVFDGNKENGLYTERDMTAPVNQYGLSKLAGENAVRSMADSYLIFRLSWVYGAGKQNFIYKLLNWAENKDILRIVQDEYSVPTSVKTIAQTTLTAIQRNLTGIFHLTDSGYASRFEWAKEIISLKRKNTFIFPCSHNEFDLPAKRPLFSAMSNEMISRALDIEIPEWQTTLSEFLKEY